MPPLAQPAADASSEELHEFIQMMLHNSTFKGTNKGPQVQLNTEIVKQISKVMLWKVWRIFKFVSSEPQKRALSDKIYEESSNFSKTMNQDEFYGLYGQKCLQALNGARNYRIHQIKDVVWNWMANNNHQDPPKLAFILACAKRRVTDANNPTLVWYLGRLLTAAAGVGDWGDSQKYFTTVSNSTFPNAPNKHHVPASTEAFCITCYSGYRDMWVNQYHHRHKHGKKTPFPNTRRQKGATPLTAEEKKWTCLYTDPDSGSTQYGGWSQEGLNKYVIWRKEIKLARADPDSNDVEARGMQLLRLDDEVQYDTEEAWQASKTNKRKAPSAVVVEEVEDLVSEEE